MPKLNIEDVLKAVFEDIAEGSEEKLKIKVGEMDEDLVQAHTQYKRKSRKLKDDIKLQMKSLELEYKRKAEELIEPMEDELHAEHDKFWNQIYNKFDLDSEKEYNVNPTEKAVYQYIE